jgi:hypothetical protein
VKRSRLFRVALVIATAVILLAQGAALGVTASPSRVSLPVQATKGDDDPTRTYSGPFVAVDPGNPLRMVAAYVELRNRRCGLMRSLDGGTTWTRLEASPVPDSYPFCLATNNNIFHAHMAFGRNGTLYYAFTGWDLQDGGLRIGNTSVLVGRSKDLGDTWETTVARDARGLQGNDMEQNRPISGIVVDTKTGKEDAVYVTYRRQLPNIVAPNAAPIRPMVVASTDGGRSFGEPVDLTVGVFDSDAVREEAFKTTTTLGGPQTSTTLGPAGTLAAKPNQAGNFGGGTSAMTGDDKGTIYAVWASITFNMANNPAAALYLSRSTDRGKTWTSSQLAPFDQKNTTFPDPPRLAWTPAGGAQGTLHLVRQRAPRPELASVRDIIYQRSTDGGKTWSEPKTLNDDDPAGLRYHGIPNITAAPNGRVDVAWWDTRHDNGARVNDVYYASSADGGLSWSKNIRITDRSVDRSIGVWGFNFDMSTPPGLASTNAFAMLTWDDTRNSEPGASASVFTGGYGGGLQDVYAAAVQYEAVGSGTSSVAKAALAGAVGLVVVGVILSVVALMSRRRGDPPTTSVPGRSPAAVG